MGEHPRFWVAFSILCSAVCLCFVMLAYLATAAHAATEVPAVPNIIDIKDDPGGNVVEYYKRYQELSKENSLIRIHGYCASACTLVLLREYTGIKACADSDALFAFHKPFQMDAHKKIVKTKKTISVSRAIWAEMLAGMPYDVYRLLKDARIPSATEGDSPDDLFVVPAIFFVPVCEAAQ